MKMGRFLLRIAFVFFLLRFTVGCTFNPSHGNFGFMGCGFHLDERGGCTCYRAGRLGNKSVMLPMEYVGHEAPPQKPMSMDHWEEQEGLEGSDFDQLDQLGHPGGPGIQPRDMMPNSETPSNSSPQSSSGHHHDHPE